MSKIKCVYSMCYCSKLNENRESISNCESNDFCQEYTGHSNEIFRHINPRCIYANSRYGEFLKTVKHYSYDSLDGLAIRDFKIPDKSIDYLKIDGRVIIDRIDLEEANDG